MVRIHHFILSLKRRDYNAQYYDHLCHDFLLLKDLIEVCSCFDYDRKMNFYPQFKNMAFQLDPERAHECSLKILERFPGIFHLFPYRKREAYKYSLNRSGLNWPFPVGLAAGLDKDARAISFFENIGMGSIEVGTVTLLPQEGNPRPRMWRYPQETSLRNSMGFPNQGSQIILERIKKSKHQINLGVNIGKNKQTSKEQTSKEYAKLYSLFAPYADYLTINISSPNTPGLRDFQQGDLLKEILQEVQKERERFRTPLLLKIAPDLDETQVKQLIKTSQDFQLNGVIATNTTRISEYGEGGISGSLLYNKARDIRNLCLNETKDNPDFSIVGVGGFENFEQILDFWKNGGAFVQVYTAFIYQGPQLLVDIEKKIDSLLLKSRCSSLEELLSNKKLLQKL